MVAVFWEGIVEILGQAYKANTNHRTLSHADVTTEGTDRKRHNN